MIIVDTNVLIDFINNRLSLQDGDRLEAILSSKQYAISVVSRIETMVGLEYESNPNVVLELLSSATVIDIWPEIEAETIRIRKAYKLKLPDAIIAATAVFLDSTLATNDSAGFKKVLGLDVWVPQRI